MDDFELRSSSSVRSYIDGLIASVNKQASDVVHLQHEYCFFGRSLQRSNSEFYRFAKQVKKPLVVTLHTPDRLSKIVKTPKKSPFFPNPWDAIRALAQRKNLYNALCCCDAIVVHTHDTYTLVEQHSLSFAPKFGSFRFRSHRSEAGAHDATINKNEGDQWILLPGFVSPYKGHRYAVEALEKLPEQFKLVDTRWWARIQRSRSCTLLDGTLGRSGEEGLAIASSFHWLSRNRGRSGSGAETGRSLLVSL